LKSISRGFIKQIIIIHSDPSYLDIEGGADYTRMVATIGTTDFGDCYQPMLGDEGILAFMSFTQGYNLEALGSIRTWMYQRRFPFVFEYPYLEFTKPLVFTHRTIAYSATEKSAWVYASVLMRIRFIGSDKANPRFSKGISFGGIP